MAKVDVELWDTSGNSKFDNCWPALAREAHGVMFVFHPGKDIFILLNFVLFCKKNNVVKNIVKLLDFI